MLAVFRILRLLSDGDAAKTPAEEPDFKLRFLILMVTVSIYPLSALSENDQINITPRMRICMAVDNRKGFVNLIPDSYSLQRN